MKRTLGWWVVATGIALAVAIEPAAMAAEQKTEKKEEAPKEKKPKPPKKSVCDNKLLSYSQRYLCGQQMAQVQTKPELKKVEERYSNIVREIERKQKEEHE
jgi:hypothetical protein